MLTFLLKNRPNQVFSTFPENPDLADVQIAIKHAKIDENSKLKKTRKINPRASIWHRFHKNPSTSAIFTAF